MLRRLLAVGALAVLVASVEAQEAGEEKKLRFTFKEASLDAVLQFVSQHTGWIFVVEKTVSGKIEAVSDTDVPVSTCLDFLNLVLKRHGVTIPNQYSPRLPRPGEILRVQDVDEAKRRNIEIHVGGDPDLIPILESVRTQIIPLKAVNVVEVNKELGELLKSSMGADGQMAVSTYSNSIVFTGRSDGINRAARILRVIDVSASGELKVRVFPLKNADATETAKVLNEVFKKEAQAGQTGQQNPMQGFMNMFRGGGGEGGRGGGPGGSGPSARALAHEMVRITAEPRTNSVVVSATEDNLKIIEELILKLDDKAAAAIKLKLYALRYADATNSAKLINDIFADTPTNQQSGRNGGGGRGGPQLPVWMGGQAGSAAEPQGATKEVRAVADIRTNSVLVAASEQKLLLIDKLMEEVDRQINDLLEVKIYKLQNADPAIMATVLQALFRPQITATQNSGSGSTRGNQGNQAGGGGGMAQMFGMGGGRQGGGQAQSNPLLPSQEIEITSDVRTRSVIVKASREYIAVMDDVVKQLDSDPTETAQTRFIRLKSANATNVATAIQNLMRGTGTGTSGASALTGRTGLQGQTSQPNQGMNGRNNGNGNMQNSSGGSTRSGTSSPTRSGTNLGPLDPQDPPAAAMPQDQDELQRRSIEGTLDIVPDQENNGIIVRGSPRNFQAIQALVEEMDRPRPQVLIKVLIADVTLDENTQFGVEGFWENKMHVRGGDLATNRLGTDFALATQGFSYLLTGDEFQASLNMFAREGRLKVLATPRILALDNQTANISVGKEVPRISNTTVNQLGNTVNTVQYENIGILLDVTPLINPDGLVTLTVAPEISDVASESESVEISPGVRNPTFNVNRASTTVAVRNGTTVVIGGLIRETMDDSVQKIPVLGDIPLIGTFFSNTTQRKVKRELMIFLTPYVAFTARELEEITQLEKSKLKLMDPRDIQAESDTWLDRMR